jgi:RHS repeat-associated protein
MLRSSTTSFYQADGLGSVTSLSNSTGSLAQTYTFDSFGNQTASSGSLTNPFQYTAREIDPETGLYYYRARYYDPGTGKFLSEDPLEFGGSGPNFYVYVFNSAINLLDPTGLLPGQKYQSLKCAGWNAIRDINQTSKHRSPAWPHGREYGGWMYKNPDGTYSYTAPVPGGAAGVSTRDFRPIPRRAQIAGDYHTHGGYDPDFNGQGINPGQPGYKWRNDGNEVFSPDDMDSNETEGPNHSPVPGFLGTPQGTTEEYLPRPGHPRGGRVIVLTRNPCECQ